MEPFTGALTLAAISGVSKEGRGTDTLSRLHTLLIRSTVSITSTLEGVGGAEAIVRVTSGADGTDTAEGADLVLAKSSEAAGSGGGCALVDVSAGAVRVAVEASRTGAVGHAPCDANTLRPLCALRLGLAALEDAVAGGVHVVGGRTATVSTIAGLAGDEGVSIVTGGTLAVKGSGEILTEGVLTTDRVLRRGQSTLVNIPAEARGFSLESSLTHTFALAAEFSCRTGLRGAALLLAASSTGNIRVSREAAGTQTPVVSGGVVTEGALATRIAETLVDVNTSLEAGPGWLVSLVTHAPGLTIE